jgi:aerobic carbon-monoxide dehydrogenase medium subunit
MLRPFELHQPTTVEEASRLLGRYGDDAGFYAGGTELLLVMKEGLLRYTHLVDLKTIPGLDRIAYDTAANTLRIGALATHAAVERSPVVARHFPLLTEVESTVANVRVKNVGTLGGNLCFAEPHADPGTLCVACDAVVRLEGPAGGRDVPAGEFFVGAYETARRPDEVLTGIRLPAPGPRTRGVYMKFGFHERPTLGVAVLLTLDGDGDARIADTRVAVGCVNPRPTRLFGVEAKVNGRTVADVLRTLKEISEAAAGDVAPADDLHGTADYKMEMTKVFVRRALRAAGARFDGARAP